MFAKNGQCSIVVNTVELLQIVLEDKGMKYIVDYGRRWLRRKSTDKYTV